MIFSPSNECRIKACPRLGLLTIGSKDIVLEYTVRMASRGSAGNLKPPDEPIFWSSAAVRFRKPDPKRRAAVNPIFGPYLPMVPIDNGARDGQAHAHPLSLAGEKWFEDLF